MKKILITLTFFLSLNVNSQSNCAAAAPFCAGGTSGVTFPAGTGGTGAQTGPNYGCLGSQPNPAWYFLQVGTSGNLVLGIAGTGGGDVDFICWGPFSSLSGACSSLTAGNTVDCSYSGSPTETCTIPTAVAGQYYMILITNFSGITQNVTFNQVGGTGSTNCGILAANSSTICAGSSATIVANNSTGMPSPTYSLNPGGLTSTTPTFVVTPLVTTNYTVYVSSTTTVVPTQTALATVVVNPRPIVSPTFTQVTCTNTLNAVNLNLTFNPGSATPTYTVMWSPTPSTISASQTVGSGLSAGITNVIVTAAGGCTAAASFTMLSITIPTFALTNTSGSFSITCLTQTINLNAATNYTSGTANFNWINSPPTLTSTTASITITNANLGNYTVTLTDPSTNCATSQTFAIGQNTAVPVNTLSATSAIINCNSTCPTFTSTVTSPTTNITTSWYAPGSAFPGGAAPITNGTVNIANICSPGQVTVVTLNNVNGCSNIKFINISTTSAFPTFNATSSTNFTLGCNSPVNTTTLCMAAATSTNGPVQYAFVPPTSTLTAPIPTTNFNAQSCTTTPVPGVWTLIVLDPISGCQTPIPVTVLSNTTLPNITASMLTQTLTCTNPTVFAIGNSNTPGVNVTWLLPAAPFSSPSPSITIGASSGTFVGTGPNTNTALPNPYAIYTVVATNTVSQCKSTLTLQISQNFSPPRNIGLGTSSPSYITCDNRCVTISFTNTALSTSISIPSNTWTTPAPAFVTSTLSSLSACAIGSYSIGVKDNQNGCITNTVINIVEQNNTPILTALPVFTLDCSATASTSAAQIQIALTNTISSWSIFISNYPGQGTSNAASFSNFNITNPPNGMTVTPTGVLTTTFTVDKVGDYRFVIKNLATGCTKYGEFQVINGGLNADFNPSASTGYAPLTVNFSNLSSSSSTATGTSSITTVWSFGNGAVQTTTATNITTNATYLNPGTYTVMMVSTKGSCIDSTYKVIKVEIPSKLEIPNVFTPNGDGSNDVFFLKTSNLTEITALIFDRWGNKVYDLTSSTGNIAWDGKNLEQKECAAGTYFYIIKATGKDGTEYEKKGNVSLYR